MKPHILFLLLVALLLPATLHALEIDDSSYESLFHAAQRVERTHFALRDDTLDALVKYDQLDLLLSAASSHPKDYSDAVGRLAKRDAERLFSDGRIDDGLAFLRKICPPKPDSDKITRFRYISEALLEHKRFDLAWQLVNPDSAGDGRIILEYIQRVMAWTYDKKPPQDKFWPTPHVPRNIPSKEDAELYRMEANRVVEYLKTYLKQTGYDDQHEYLTGYLLAEALAEVGRCDEAYALIKDKKNIFRVLEIILRERCKNGTQEEIDHWFGKLREIYLTGELPFIFGSRELAFFRPCLEARKFHDVMDLLEKLGEVKDYSTSAHASYFGMLIRHIIKTDFRGNSKELIDRIIKFNDDHGDPNEPDEVPGYFGYYHARRSWRWTYCEIIKLQLNLGLLDDALESLRKIGNSLAARELLDDILAYCEKNNLSEKAKQIEAEMSGIPPKKAESSEERRDHVFSDIEQAIQLLKDGKAEEGARLLQATFDETPGYGKTISEWLISAGYPDEAQRIIDQLEDRDVLSQIYLRIARKHADAEETESAKSALRKAREELRDMPFSSYGYYAMMARLAAELGEKEMFYEIMHTGMKVADEKKWHENGYACGNSLSFFAHQLTVYGDGENPFFARAEKIADDLKEMNCRGDLFFSLGISQAKFGDHVTARRLLKKGIESRHLKGLGMDPVCPAIIEARSYETGARSVSDNQNPQRKQGPRP